MADESKQQLVQELQAELKQITRQDPLIVKERIERMEGRI